MLGASQSELAGRAKNWGSLPAWPRPAAFAVNIVMVDPSIRQGVRVSGSLRRDSTFRDDKFKT